MKRLLKLCFCLCCLLPVFVVSTSNISAEVATNVAGWQAAYWNNTDLEGAPVLVQLETDQNHNPELRRNWGNSPPWPTVNQDYFSARYERTLVLQPGRYRFSAAADDGVRVWVNGHLIIDEWFNQVATTHLGYFDQTSASNVTIRVEYYDNQHDALLTVTWDRIFGSDSAVTGSVYQPNISQWKGEYFNNRVLAGTPAITRNDEKIDFDWGLNTPAVEAMNADGFSVRWTRTLNLPAGTYRFKTETDDGVRLYLNGRLAIDQWRNQTFSPHTTDLNHGGGAVAVKMEYYDEIGLAAARLTWEKIGEATATTSSGSSGYWRGEYFNNTELLSRPAVTRIDSAINFDWGTNPPASQIVRDAFSVRWTGTLNLPAGDYRFTTTSDDGVRLSVNNNTVIDKWHKQPLLTYSADVTLPGGPVPVVMTYYNAEHKAVAKLDWKRLDGERLEIELGANKGLVPIGGGGARSTSVGVIGGGGKQAQPSTQSNATLSGEVATVDVVTLNVRTEASILSAVQGKVQKDQPLPIIGRNQFNNWLQVELPDQRLGWVSILYVDLPEGLDIKTLDVVDNPTTAVAIDQNNTEAVISGTVTSNLSTVRMGPSYLAVKISKLAVGTDVKVIGRNEFSTWIQLELADGDIGWISVRFIELAVPVSALPEVEA